VTGGRPPEDVRTRDEREKTTVGTVSPQPPRINDDVTQGDEADHYAAPAKAWVEHVAPLAPAATQHFVGPSRARRRRSNRFDASIQTLTSSSTGA